MLSALRVRRVLYMSSTLTHVEYTGSPRAMSRDHTRKQHGAFTQRLASQEGPFCGKWYCVLMVFVYKWSAKA